MCKDRERLQRVILQFCLSTTSAAKLYSPVCWAITVSSTAWMHATNVATFLGSLTDLCDDVYRPEGMIAWSGSERRYSVFVLSNLNRRSFPTGTRFLRTCHEGLHALAETRDTCRLNYFRISNVQPKSCLQWRSFIDVEVVFGNLTLLVDHVPTGTWGLHGEKGP